MEDCVIDDFNGWLANDGNIYQPGDRFMEFAGKGVQTLKAQ